MFSINDANDTEESVEIQVKNYAEIGHTHEIQDVVSLEDTINELKEQINELASRITKLESMNNVIEQK